MKTASVKRSVLVTLKFISIKKKPANVRGTNVNSRKPVVGSDILCQLQ